MPDDPRPRLDLDRFRTAGTPPSGPEPAPASPATGGAPSLGLVERERRVREILASLEHVPSLPDVVMRVLELAGRSDTAAGDFEQIVRRDQALTARVLKLVNSPFFGQRNEVTTIPHAIVVLGFRTLKSIVLAARTSDLLNRNLGPYGYEKDGMFRHSMGAATLSQRFAVRVGLGPDVGEQLFVAGLLHDIGQVILAPYVGRSGAEFTRALEAHDGDVVAAELQVIGISHAEVGGRMAQTWHLPVRLRQIIERHHDVRLPGGDLPFDRELAIVQLADELCDHRKPSGGKGAAPPSAHRAGLLEGLGLAGDADAVVAEATKILADLEQLIQAMHEHA